jgi:hypothetical protein
LLCMFLAVLCSASSDRGLILCFFDDWVDLAVRL